MQQDESKYKTLCSNKNGLNTGMDTSSSWIGVAITIKITAPFKLFYLSPTVQNKLPQLYFVELER